MLHGMGHGQIDGGNGPWTGGADNLKLRTGFWCLDVCRDISVDRS
jgi:hypothetical protein